LTKDCLGSGEGPLNACARVFSNHKIHHVKLLARDELISLNLSQAKEKLKTEFNLFVQTEAPKLERYINDKLRKA
jgi:hypothetical protein